MVHPMGPIWAPWCTHGPHLGPRAYVLLVGAMGYNTQIPYSAAGRVIMKVKLICLKGPGEGDVGGRSPPEAKLCKGLAPPASEKMCRRLKNV